MRTLRNMRWGGHKVWRALLPVVVIGVTGALAWWGWQLAQLTPGDRADASGYGQFVLAALTLLAGLAMWAFKKLKTSKPSFGDEQVDQLAAAVRAQWTKAAMERRLLEPAPLPIRWRRSSLPIAPPVDGAIRSVRFAPLPGLESATGLSVLEGLEKELHAVYGGLGSGRLLIVGPPGAGKSAAAILLLLDALRFREQVSPELRIRVPVPVLFTLHGWDPAGQTVNDWVASQLARTYPLLAGRSGLKQASELLASGRIAVFLDGLDEISEQLRPVALSALGDQATFRLVVLTRSLEMIVVAADATLAGAVALDLQPVDRNDAAKYLLSPLVDPAPVAWKQLASDLLRGESSLAKALDNPLTLSLIRDTYRPADDVAELLDGARFGTVTDIEDHLLDRALIAAYTPRPGQPVPRYSLVTARRTLGYLARQLNEVGTRDLEWWRLRQWLPRMPRILSWVFAGSLLGASAGVVTGGLLGMIGGLVVGLAFGSLFALSNEIGEELPVRREPVSWRALFSFRAVYPGIAFGLVGEGVGELVFDTVGGFTMGIVGWFVFGLERPSAGQASVGDPPGTWRQDGSRGLLLGLGMTISIWILTWLADRAVFGAPWPLLVVVPMSMVLIGALESQAGRAAIAQAQLAGSQRTPLRLIRFLEDARARHVLRTVGPVYQFRHAKLQDRLAADVAGVRQR